MSGFDSDDHHCRWLRPVFDGIRERISSTEPSDLGDATFRLAYSTLDAKLGILVKGVMKGNPRPYDAFTAESWAKETGTAPHPPA